MAGYWCDDNFDGQAILLLCAEVSVSAELLVSQRHVRKLIFHYFI